MEYQQEGTSASPASLQQYISCFRIHEDAKMRLQAIRNLAERDDSWLQQQDGAKRRNQDLAEKYAELVSLLREAAEYASEAEVVFRKECRRYVEVCTLFNTKPTLCEHDLLKHLTKSVGQIKATVFRVPGLLAACCSFVDPQITD